MTRKNEIDQVTLMAFADGELSPEDAVAVVMHLADHPEDQAFVDDLMASNVAIAKAYAEPATEATPQRLEALILGEGKSKESLARKVSIFKPRGAVRLLATGTGSAGLAVAATVAAVSILPADPTGIVTGPIATGTALEIALATTRTGGGLELPGEGEFLILSTVKTQTGAYCREFEVRSTALQQTRVGLACRENDTWTVDGIVAEYQPGIPAQGAGYVPASGGQSGLVDQWLERRGATETLSIDEENRLLTNDWTPGT